MAFFHLCLASPLPAAQAFAQILDLDAHTALIPFTAVQHVPPLRRGSVFVARTAIGPIGLNDRMHVLAYAPPQGGEPGRCTIAKTGRWLRGNIHLTVHPSDAGCTVRWRQDLRVRGLPRLADPVVCIVATRAYRTVLTRLLARS